MRQRIAEALTWAVWAAVHFPFCVLVMYINGLRIGVGMAGGLIGDPGYAGHILRCENCGPGASVALACWGPTIIALVWIARTLI